MSLLIDIRDADWLGNVELKTLLMPLLPGVDVYCWGEEIDLDSVKVLTASKLYAGVAAQLPNLQLVQKIGAGVDGIVNDPDLNDSVRVARLKPDIPAHEIAEYCVAYVLEQQRNLRFHAANQLRGAWKPLAPRKSFHTTVGVLGLGHIGSRTARYFAGLGFRVVGWSRSAKKIEGVDCRFGEDVLPELLGECDYVACILPSTKETINLFDAALIANMKPGAMLINAGRGDLIVEQALIAALDCGHLSRAVLDVFREEPLSEDDPYWHHKKVTITPHVSGWHVDGGLEDVAENYQRLVTNQPLLHEVSRAAGY